MKAFLWLRICIWMQCNATQWQFYLRENCVVSIKPFIVIKHFGWMTTKATTIVEFFWNFFFLQWSEHEHVCSPLPGYSLAINIHMFLKHRINGKSVIQKWQYEKMVMDATITSFVAYSVTMECTAQLSNFVFFFFVLDSASFNVESEIKNKNKKLNIHVKT